MMRIAGASLLFATLAATTACGVGNDPAGGGGGSDDRTKLGILCSASLKITGTFARAATPQPEIDPDTGLPLTGCWPVGTWTFSATVDSNTCKTAPTLLSSYSFRVDRVENGPDGQGFVDSYTNMTTVGAMNWHVGVSSNGQGCEGHLELGSADGTEYWQMQPALLKTDPTKLVGSGDYDLYNGNGWPWK